MIGSLFSKILPSRILILCGVVLLLKLQPVFAEIYVSTSTAGLQKWSTQAFDLSYEKTSIIEDQSLSLTKLLSQNPLKGKMVSKLSNSNNLTGGAPRLPLQNVIATTSNKYGVDPELVEALIAVESNFNTNAISPKGARGLMQLMPATAKRYGMKSEQDLHIPSKNIDMGVRHLKDLLNLHNGQVSLAIASYNAGLAAVSKYGQRIPQYRETMIYVPAVLAYMARNSDVSQDIKQP